ncbi:hypothetical protein C8034_v003061 [Colletotrichum sidae]|uniref:Uncharacterized protein n=1 Tax=Colletotrichum sidae TaxID=1347389 RepID=A0A4V3I2K1_9PEZI|nr:hypothetical protein C8034_v003061 [Colletotrichum sidae]
MKLSVSTILVSLVSAAAAQDEMSCWASGVPSTSEKSSLEWALKNRATELGIPGGSKFTWVMTSCIDDESRQSRPFVHVVVPGKIIQNNMRTTLSVGVINCERVNMNPGWCAT